MTSDQTRQVKELFLEALDMEEGKRATFLESIDPSLASEVSSLLASHTKAAGFLTPPHIGMSARDTDERIGNLVGPYRIVREIAQGGMGEVYEALRSDGVFDRRVAIKLVRHGMSRAELLKRFELERRTLAQLDHPNIARLLDGGTTEDGIPYLVMEFVDGKRIDEYCDEQKLSIQQRLSLLLTVCSAVQYAHQRLVVHRDLKPNNILITAEGEPKLLDFGIAKLLTNDSVEAGQEITRTGFNIFTPEYASPEQIRGKLVTTASDVYSLGVLLYKLLTGQKPYEFKSPLPHDVARTVLEAEPAKPSSKNPTIRSTVTREKIRRMLAGDLDNIILNALRKEEARRYVSIEQFADDIKRHLTGLPVSARPNTFSYRAGKFVKRNRIGLIAAAAILVSLLGGLAATLHQVHVANAERAKAESISAFLKKMLNYSNPVLMSSRKSPGEMTMAEVLDEATKRIEGGEFDNQPIVKAELEWIIAVSYNYQGRYDVATRHYQEYVDLQKRLYSADDPRALDARGVEASLLFGRGELAKAEEMYREVVPLLRSQYRSGHGNADALAEVLNTFGSMRRAQGDSREAELLFRETLQLIPFMSDEQKYMSRLTRSTLASTLADQGKFDEALQTAQDAVFEVRENGLKDTPDYGFSLTVLGGLVTEKGDFAGADSTLRAAETIFRRRLKPSHLWLGDNLRNQAISLYQQGRFVPALEKITEARTIYSESFGKLYDHYPTALTLQGLILNKTGRSIDGERLLREAVRIRTETLPKGHFFTALAQSALGECLTTQKRFAEAEPLLVGSYESLKISQGENNPRTMMAKHRLAELYQAMKKSELAVKYRD